MCTNEINEKEILVKDRALKYIHFFFRDYTGNKITYDDGYYYTLELKLIY